MIVNIQQQVERALKSSRKPTSTRCSFSKNENDALRACSIALVLSSSAAGFVFESISLETSHNVEASRKPKRMTASLFLDLMTIPRPKRNHPTSSSLDSLDALSRTEKRMTASLLFSSISSSILAAGHRLRKTPRPTSIEKTSNLELGRIESIGV
jgi:hypothetical protein